MSSAAKDTIYIDIDDEITSIIEKVQDSPHKIVALVLPKRAAMLQSIVNMKLLKRSADDANKSLVLITSEAGLLPLAGAVGIHAAKTLQSKPEIPKAPVMQSDETEVSEDAELDPTKPIGALAAASLVDTDDTIEVDSPEEEAAVSAASKSKSKKKEKKLRVPNFGKFRTRLFLGGLAVVLLLVGWYFASFVLPKATITIKTDTSSVTSDLTVTVRPGLEELNEEQSVVPGDQEELRKTDTQKTAATGQKDIGKKASGEVTLSLTDCSQDEVTIPAGTGVSSGDLTFITTSDATLVAVQFGNQCRNSDFPQFSSETVGVTAQNAGDQYNVAAKSYSVSGHSNVAGQGTEMTGGTSKVVKVVRQEDIDTAKKTLLERNDDAAKEELSNQLEANGYFPISETFKTGKSEVASTPNVGDEASEVTITSTVVYTMTGLKTSELEKLIAKDVEGEIDTSRQAISDYGLDQAVFRVLGAESNGDVRLSIQTVVTAGPQIDEAQLKEEIKGKKKGETVELIKSRPGVTDVEIDFSPFWVFSTPRDTDKITITFENADDTETDANNDGQ